MAVAPHEEPGGATVDAPPPAAGADTARGLSTGGDRSGASDPGAVEGPTVRVLTDTGDVVIDGLVTPALARVLVTTARVNHRVEEKLDLSFSSMLITLLGSADPVSSWFRSYLSSTTVAVPELLAMRDIDDEEQLTTILEAPIETVEVDRPLIASRSATTLLTAAQRVAGPALATQRLDVAHLIGAYIYDGAGHDRDFDVLGFNRPDWSVAFVTFMARRRPAEIKRWVDHHTRRYPDAPLGTLDPSGPSTHITSDLWTTDDSLGYSSYAFALAKFISHERTSAPLAIGIQAPWGGGKTSLMRMVADELQREAAAAQPEPVVESTLAEEPAPGTGGADVGLNIGEVLDLSLQEAREPASNPLEGLHPAPLVVWFNAWKYEVVEAVLAAARVKSPEFRSAAGSGRRSADTDERRPR